MTNPFQYAADSATAASYTLTDLFEINDERRDALKRGRQKRGRPDSRQISLYKSIITSSIAALEEFIESFILVGFLEVSRLEDESFRSSENLKNFLSRKIGREMQNPTPSRISSMSQQYLGYKITDDWKANLYSSQIRYKVVERKKGRNKVELSSQSYTNVSLSGSQVVSVLDKFCKVRNSFAHQDSSVNVFSSKEIQKFENIIHTREISDGQKDMLEVISCSSAFFLKEKIKPGEDPLLSWTVHERHCINSLYLFLNLVTSSIDGVMNYLSKKYGVEYDPVVFEIEKGRWAKHLEKNEVFGSENVSLRLVDYSPKSRIRGND